mmetsp:Transcript_44583/g.88087  ORF Transcript_44583/g.88087 Transcript_44583/m.88087 type:complete len:106 (+) Transcript_44583:379-696(+)
MHQEAQQLCVSHRSRHMQQGTNLLEGKKRSWTDKERGGRRDLEEETQPAHWREAKRTHARRVLRFFAPPPLPLHPHEKPARTLKNVQETKATRMEEKEREKERRR